MRVKSTYRYAPRPRGVICAGALRHCAAYDVIHFTRRHAVQQDGGSRERCEQKERFCPHGAHQEPERPFTVVVRGGPMPRWGRDGCADGGHE